MPKDTAAQERIAREQLARRLDPDRPAPHMEVTQYDESGDVADSARSPLRKRNPA
jgi:hypothetical protein